MTFSKKEQWVIFIAINSIALLALALFPFYDEYVRVLPTTQCNLVVVMGLYCPACGGTRAFKALCELDIIRSFIYNPIVPIGGAFAVIYEGVMIKYLILKKERPMLVKIWMVVVVLSIWFGYFTLRNLLLCFGVDILGDILH